VTYLNAGALDAIARSHSSVDRKHNAPGSLSGRTGENITCGILVTSRVPQPSEFIREIEHPNRDAKVILAEEAGSVAHPDWRLDVRLAPELGVVRRSDRIRDHVGRGGQRPIPPQSPAPGMSVIA
jgi:hypothetical protein